VIFDDLGHPEAATVRSKIDHLSGTAIDRPAGTSGVARDKD
jgi:hypothetical protein